MVHASAQYAMLPGHWVWTFRTFASAEGTARTQNSLALALGIAADLTCHATEALPQLPSHCVQQDCCHHCAEAAHSEDGCSSPVLLPQAWSNPQMTAEVPALHVDPPMPSCCLKGEVCLLQLDALNGWHCSQSQCLAHHCCAHLSTASRALQAITQHIAV